jgi:hypothetical protein
MRTIKLVFLLVFVSGMISSISGLAQVEKNKNEAFELTLIVKVGPDDIREYYLSGVEIIKITPSGNLARILTFKIDSGEPIMELANPMAFLRVKASGDFDGDGAVETITDEFAVLTNSGNLKLVYHINGKSK